MTSIRRDVIDRREALRRAALMLGGVLSAPLVAGLLAGCETRRVPNGVWRPRALSPEQAELVATIAEHILPETDTPGARAVGAHQFIDAMLADAYPPRERRRFIAGLSDVDARARAACGTAFLGCGLDQQRALLAELDRETFAQPAPPPGSTEVPFFRTMKELTLVGYYTSEAGATRELRHAPVPGRYDGCVPLAQIGRTWAV
jgi:glucoside 3-dehydrogenase (cytochrome c) hitch-hiker subunit